ncbi:MAG: multiheme c-type cytochrome, partial [Oleibacter sp.]|nr:multiheme c-type cytochrome [Thalassolituus sp.]
DTHSLAYKVLLNDKSKAMAKKLGLPDAHTAKICLDCHADNVKSEYRGVKFQLTDGVGCEACHGGSEDWLASHTRKEVTHQENIENGLYPLSNPEAKATLCLSCHLGTQDKLATHTIMGAGHPRLRFDMAVFSENQPRHYTPDDDYAARGKTELSPPNAWLSGLTESAVESLNLIDQHFDSGKVFPELALFDCHSCHHAMNDQRYNTSHGVAPGAVRLNLSQAQLLIDVVAPLKLFSFGQIDLMKTHLLNMQKASQTSFKEVKKQRQLLANDVAAIKQALNSATLDSLSWIQVRENILWHASRGQYSDYILAEQVFLALDTLTLALDEGARYKPQLDAVFAAVQNESTFSTDNFKIQTQKFHQALRQ